MKKISLETLKRVAEKVPVVNEKDLEKYQGGSYYISYQGADFGQVGQSDRLSLLPTLQEYRYALENGLEYYGLDLFGATDESLSGTIYEGEHIQQTVFAAYARQVIAYNGPVKVVDDWYADDLYYVRPVQGGVSGALYFNRAHSGLIFSNEGLIQRLLQVQKQIHPDPDNPWDPGDPGSPDKDPRIEVIMAAIQDLNFADNQAKKEWQLTHDYKKYQMIYDQHQNMRMTYATQLYSIWQEQGRFGFGYEIQDAYRICKIEPLIFE